MDVKKFWRTDIISLAQTVLLWYGSACIAANIVALTEDITVAGTCQICGKGRLSGNKVSHSNNKTKKMSKPNLQFVKAVGPHGSHVRMHVCTRCIRSGKVKKIS